MNVLGLAVLLAQLGIPHLPSMPQIPPVPGVPGLPQVPSSLPLPPLVKAPPDTIEMTPGNQLRQIPELDAFVPERFSALADVPRTADGSFQLVPGAFELIDQSFCLRAGAHGPTTASAYLAGSLAGTRVSYVTTVIAGWRTHPQFTQGDVQTLLWGITSQTKISQMTPHLQTVAAALLSPQQNRGPERWCARFCRGLSAKVRRQSAAAAGRRSRHGKSSSRSAHARQLFVRTARRTSRRRPSGKSG